MCHTSLCLCPKLGPPIKKNSSPANMLTNNRKWPIKLTTAITTVINSTCAFLDMELVKRIQ